jgi:molybdopterin synthase sulfur carrier subunit
MKVNILYFAKIKELVGLDNEIIDLPSNIVSFDELKNYFISRGAPWSEIFLPENATRCALNQNLMNSNFIIEAGSEIAFFPPITGG